MITAGAQTSQRGAMTLCGLCVSAVLNQILYER